MGYLHIDNLYKDQRILMFKECWAMEKIHGTSAHIKWKVTPKMVFGPPTDEVEEHLTFYSGGVSYDSFVALFNQEALKEAFRAMGHTELTIYGEAYGGKCQKMADTYGAALRFVAFDVMHGEKFLNVEAAKEIVIAAGLEFVYVKRIPAEMEFIDAERDAPSAQAFRNGIVEPKIREGIVLRPIYETTDWRGNRIITKHKRDEFRETKTPRIVDPDKLAVMAGADAIAEEWVTPVRFDHVLDKFLIPQEDTDNPLKHTGGFIKAMVEDVEREAAGEVEMTKDARKAIGSRAAAMYRAHFTAVRRGYGE